MILSIIVPVYKTEHLLRRCVESLVNQKNLTNYEIILVNDASPDNSINVMKELQREYGKIIKIIDSKENLRQGGARNLGLDIVQGEYIAFVDSDDYVTLDAYSLMLDGVVEKNYDIIFSNNNFVIELDGRKNLLQKSQFAFDGEISVLEKKELLVNNPSVWNILYKKEFLINNKLRFIEKFIYEDTLFLNQVFFFVKNVLAKNVPFYYYCRNSESVTLAKDTGTYVDRYKTLNDTIEFYKENDADEIFEEEMEYLTILIAIVGGRQLAVRLCKKPNYELLKWIKKEYVKKIPKYKKNKYYKFHISKKNKLAMRIADFSIRLFAFLARRF